MAENHKNLKRVQAYGILVLVEAFIANLLAVIVLMQRSWILAAGYLLVCLIGGGSIIYAYCAKCPCRDGQCAHVIPGKIASILTHRETSPYTLFEIAVVGIAVLLIYGLPLLWLWGYPIVLVSFVLLMALASFQAQTVLCRNCSNIYCPLRRGVS